jgi:phosphoglycolate phosphatase
LSRGKYILAGIICNALLQRRIPVFDLNLFDLDGTLVDTRRDIEEAVNYVLQLHARPVVELATVISWVGDGVAVSKGHAHHRIEHAQFLAPRMWNASRTSVLQHPCSRPTSTSTSAS